MRRIKKNIEIIRRGPKRNLEKVIKRKLCCLPPVSVLVLLFEV